VKHFFIVMSVTQASYLERVGSRSQLTAMLRTDGECEGLPQSRPPRLLSLSVDNYILLYVAIPPCPYLLQQLATDGKLPSTPPPARAVPVLSA